MYRIAKHIKPDTRRRVCEAFNPYDIATGKVGRSRPFTAKNDPFCPIAYALYLDDELKNPTRRDAYLLSVRSIMASNRLCGRNFNRSIDEVKEFTDLWDRDQIPDLWVAWGVPYPTTPPEPEVSEPETVRSVERFLKAARIAVPISLLVAAIGVLFG